MKKTCKLNLKNKIKIDKITMYKFLKNSNMKIVKKKKGK